MTDNTKSRNKSKAVSVEHTSAYAALGALLGMGTDKGSASILKAASQIVAGTGVAVSGNSGDVIELALEMTQLPQPNQTPVFLPGEFMAEEHTDGPRSPELEKSAHVLKDLGTGMTYLVYRTKVTKSRTLADGSQRQTKESTMLFRLAEDSEDAESGTGYANVTHELDLLERGGAVPTADFIAHQRDVVKCASLLSRELSRAQDKILDLKQGHEKHVRDISALRRQLRANDLEFVADMPDEDMFRYFLDIAGGFWKDGV
jgi:hypothetical protein